MQLEQCWRKCALVSTEYTLWPNRLQNVLKLDAWPPFISTLKHKHLVCYAILSQYFNIQSYFYISFSSSLVQWEKLASIHISLRLYTQFTVTHFRVRACNTTRSTGARTRKIPWQQRHLVEKEYSCTETERRRRLPGLTWQVSGLVFQDLPKLILHSRLREPDR